MGAEIQEIAGAPGMFDVSINQNGNIITERIGSVILATGAVPYDANKVGAPGLWKV